MSAGAWSGVVTAILIVAFVGACVWVFSGRRRREFDAAARMPLEDDAARKDPPEQP